METTDVKKKMIDVDAFHGGEDVKDHSWFEGYISALVNEKIITEEQFDELMDWDCETI